MDSEKDEILRTVAARAILRGMLGLPPEEGTFCYKDGELTPVDVHEVTPDKDDDIPFCDEDCSNCCDCDELDDYGFWEEDDEEYPMWGIPDIRRVVFNNPATIIFWEDNTKTIVKCMEGEKFEKYAGFIAAVAKKLFGSTSRAKSIMNELGEEQVNVEKKAKKETVAVPDLTQAFNEVIANHESIKEAIDESLAR